jgi:hypothetical protein
MFLRGSLGKHNLSRVLHTRKLCKIRPAFIKYNLLKDLQGQLREHYAEVSVIMAGNIHETSISEWEPVWGGVH